MYRISFLAEEMAALEDERFPQPHPRVQKKMEAVYLKSRDLSHQAIADLLQVSPNTVRNSVRATVAGGIERLKEFHGNHPKSALHAHAKALEEHFKNPPVATIKEALHEIEQLTGLKRSETQVREFLQKMGLRRRKGGMIPGKATPEVQEAYLKKTPAPAG